MLTCVLRGYAASAVLILKLFANYIEGADSVRLLVAISVDRRA